MEDDGAGLSVPGDDGPIRLPMYFAAKGGHGDVVRLLLEHNADIHEARADTGATPVLMAAQEVCVLCLELLLEHNADPKSGNNRRWNHPGIHCRADRSCRVFEAAAGAWSTTPNQTRQRPTLELPLMQQLIRGEVSVRRRLVVHGANIAAKRPPITCRMAECGRHLVSIARCCSMAGALRHHGNMVLLQQNRPDPVNRVKFPATEIMAAIAASSAMGRLEREDDAFRKRRRRKRRRKVDRWRFKSRCREC